METRNQRIGRGAREAKNHSMVTYAWVCQFLVKHHGYKMADLGIGTGVGDLVMSQFAKSIDMYEIDDAVIEEAKSNDYFCPVRFIKMNLEETYPQEDYEIVTAFEILEHLVNPKVLLKEISKRCQMFIFSVPFNSSTDHRPHWKYNEVHKTLFNSDADITEMVGDSFPNLKIYYERKGIIKEEPFETPHRYIGIATK